MTRHEPASGPAASRLIDQRIRELGGWRGEALARMRGLIRDADPEVVEEWKWMGTPVWSHDGIICTGEAYTQVVKLTFARGASVPDPTGLFNASLEGNTRRAIDIRQGDTVDADAFKALVQAAVAWNGMPQARATKPTKQAPAKPPAKRTATKATAKPAAKQPTKKPTKKPAAKQPTKKAAAKQPTKKPAAKQATTKRPAKRATPKRPARRKSRG